MKPFIKEIIIVEGTNDASLISSLIDAEIVVLNGYELQNIKYLKKATKVTNLLLMTDPDKEGEVIRNKVVKEIPTCINIEVDINKCTKGSKNGIAECEKNEVLRALSKYFVKNDIKKDLKITIYTSKERNKICDKLDIEIVNNKVLNKRLNRLGISNEEIIKMLEE